VENFNAKKHVLLLKPVMPGLSLSVIEWHAMTKA